MLHTLSPKSLVDLRYTGQGLKVVYLHTKIIAQLSVIPVKTVLDFGFGVMNHLCNGSESNRVGYQFTFRSNKYKVLPTCVIAGVAPEGEQFETWFADNNLQLFATKTGRHAVISLKEAV